MELQAVPCACAGSSPSAAKQCLEPTVGVVPPPLEKLPHLVPLGFRGRRTHGLHNFQHLPLQWVFTSGSQHGLCGLLGTFLPGKILLCPALTLIHYFPTSALFVRGEWLRGAGFHCCQHRIHRKQRIAGEIERTGPSWFLTFENGTRHESRQ